MSTSRFNPSESNYWSSPRLKIPIKPVNLDINHNVGGSLPATYGKSLSEPSSPQLWHKGICLLIVVNIKKIYIYIINNCIAFQSKCIFLHVRV